MQFWARLGLVAVTGCAPARAPISTLRFETYPAQLALAVPTPDEPLRPPPPAPPQATAPALAGARIDLGLDRERVELPAGRWAVSVALPERRMVSVGVLGPEGPARIREGSLRDFSVIGRGKMRTLHTRGDGRLPAFVALRTGAEPEPLIIVVDADRPITLLRAAAERFDPEAREPHGPLPLVGLPLPLDASAGYDVVEPRYGFVRADVAEALRDAFRATRRKFGRSRIWIGDASQWNGERPASDQGRPRHISHDGGRDVDIALPARGAPSQIVKRCDVVLQGESSATCAPGTVRDFDAERLAYFLAQLVGRPDGLPDGAELPTPVEVIFTDQAYIDSVRQVLPELYRRRAIGREAFDALGEEGVLRASPWHTDHVHVRFAGAPGVVLPAFAR